MIHTYRIGDNMRKYEIDQQFKALTEPLEEMHELEAHVAFTPESRPIPKGLADTRLPLGHIAFMGDRIQQLVESPTETA